jgi:protein tyrosine phosphatase type 4A
VYEMPYSDGEAPPDIMLSNWLNLCKQEFGKLKPPTNSGSSSGAVTAESKEVGANSSAKDVIGSSKEAKHTIAVHCVAGLGRAPVLVCVALIEYCNMSPLDAVDYVRKRRRGAINAKQLKFLESYKPKMKNGKDKCIIC